MGTTKDRHGQMLHPAVERVTLEQRQQSRKMLGQKSWHEDTMRNQQSAPLEVVRSMFWSCFGLYTRQLSIERKDLVSDEPV